MGNKYATMNIHICGLNTNDQAVYDSEIKILDKLFPEKDEKKSNNNYIVKYCKKPKWNAYIYSRFNTKNFQLISEIIINQTNSCNGEEAKNKTQEEKNELKNHMILFFVNDNDSDISLCKKFSNEEIKGELVNNFPLMLFLYKDIERSNTYYKDYIFDFSYINCLNLSLINIQNNNEEKEEYIAIFLKKFLYNNYDSYFTERGRKIVDEVDIFSNKQKLGIYLPIILVGSPGVGKSTFINILNGSRISKASSSDDPITSKSAYYDVKIPGNGDNEILMVDGDIIQEAYIRFVDTPGFDLEKDIKIALKEIERIFNDFKEGKEKVPVILFFMNPFGRNSTKDEGKKKEIFKILKLIKDNKAKIIFVITHIPKNGKWQKEYSFIKSLKEQGLEDLVETNKSNIIKCDLIGEDAYGIKEIFDKIHTYLNVIVDDNNKPTGKIYTQSFINDIEHIQNFDEKLKYIKTKTSLFDHFETKEDIIAYGNKRSSILIYSMTGLAAAAGAIPIPFTDIPIVISIQAGTIIKIGKNYGYIWKTISKNDLVSIYKGELYNPNQIQIQNQDNLHMNIEDITKLIGETFFKGVGMMIASNIDDIFKLIWGIGTIIGSVVGSIIDGGIVYKYSNNAKKYYESKCKTDDGTIFLTTRCAEYEIIFRQFELFKNFNLIYPSE